MSATLSWKRVGKGSGPGNVLNEHYEVFKSERDWKIKDLTTGAVVPHRAFGYPTMALARRRAEALARDGAA